MGLGSSWNEFERAQRCVEQMKAASSFEEYEDAWMGFLDATYRIPNRIMNACNNAVDPEKKGLVQSWFGNFTGRRKGNPFLVYSLHARHAETHSIQITTERQTGQMSFKSTGSTHIQEINIGTDGLPEFVGSGSPLKVEIIPSKVVMSSVVDSGVEYEPPDQGPPHPHAEAALSFFEEWIKAAEEKFFPKE